MDLHNQMIYMDYNATTPLAEQVIEEMSIALKELWGNPSSGHPMGKKARNAIELSRSRVAKLISANSNEIVFTSGGTEANNWIINAAVERFYKLNQNEKNGLEIGINHQMNKPHVVTTTIEHDSIVKPLDALKEAGKIDVAYVPVSKISGQVVPSDVSSALRPSTCLVTVMLANNETGVVQPVAEVVEVVRKYQNRQRPILCHTDAAQALGKIEVDVNVLGVDSLTIVGHKLYGPRNGALYVRRLGSDVALNPFILGGGQEKGFRSGTENTVDIVGLGKAAELISENLTTYSSHMQKIKRYLEHKLSEEFGDHIRFNSRFQCDTTLPNTVNVSLVGDEFKGNVVLSKCQWLAASSGAACHTGGKPSKILLASGISENVAANAMRLSVGRETTEANVDAAVKDLKQASNTAFLNKTI